LLYKFDFVISVLYILRMTIHTTENYCTIIEGALICRKHLTLEELLHTYNCYGDYYYGAFIGIALKAEIDFDFIRRLQRHIENIARITDTSIDEDVMANTMGYIWRWKNPDPAIDDLLDSFGVD